VVLERHRDSAYADDALLLMARSLFQLGRHADASAAFRRFLERFPDSDRAAEARLGLARSERRLGDYAAARASLGALTGERNGGLEPAELLYERAMIELGMGEHRAAVESLRELLREHPEYANRHRLALQFADAELAAGEHAAAIEAYAAYREEATDPAERRRVALDMARAMAVAGRSTEAIAAYGDLLAEDVSDSLAGVALAERGELYAAAMRWDEADADFRRTAELAPGTPAAARATLGRARIVWHVRGEREPALEMLLDGFLHAPTSAWGDSAREEARALERVLHYRRIVDGRQVVTGLDDPEIVRATALYRLAEEVLDVEEDPAVAASIFGRVAREHPASPWAPQAQLASGLLAREAGEVEAGEATLRRLVAEHPDDPAADSARLALGMAVPERLPAFYAPRDVLAALAAVLPPPTDPMLRVLDQLGKYARGQGTPGAVGAMPGGRGAPPEGPGAPAATSEEEAPPEPTPRDPRLPAGVTP
jgi:outer membrane protein assembly factor BamD (BamD/ComL family)